MPEWRGDKTVLAANRALAAEATVAELAWRRGLARKSDPVSTSVRIRTFARSASRAAAVVGKLADRMAEVAEEHPGMIHIAEWHARNAEAAEKHAARAHAAVERSGVIKEIR